MTLECHNDYVKANKPVKTKLNFLLEHWHSVEEEAPEAMLLVSSFEIDPGMDLDRNYFIRAGIKEELSRFQVCYSDRWLKSPQEKGKELFMIVDHCGCLAMDYSNLKIKWNLENSTVENSTRRENQLPKESCISYFQRLFLAPSP